MGRPKVSPRIKNIALAFVKIVAKGGIGSTAEDCISINAQYGRKSLHSAMQFCLPHLTRSGTVAENREGISQMELNKLVRSQGHTMARKRDSIHPGRREWTDIQWVAPCATTKDADYIQVESGLAELHREFPETECCTVDSIIDFIAIARRPMTESDYAKAMEERLARGASADSCDDDDDDDDDAPAPAKRRTSPATAFSRCSSARTVPRDTSISRTTSLYHPDAAHYAAGIADDHHGGHVTTKRPVPRHWADLVPESAAAGAAGRQANKRAKKAEPGGRADGAFALADVSAPFPVPSAYDPIAAAAAAALHPYPASFPPPPPWPPAPYHQQQGCYVPSGPAPPGGGQEAMAPLLPGLVGELLRSQLLLSQYSTLLRSMMAAPGGGGGGGGAGPAAAAPLQPLHLTMQSLLPQQPPQCGGGGGEAPDPAAIAAAVQLSNLHRAAQRAAAVGHSE